MVTYLEYFQESLAQCLHNNSNFAYLGEDVTTSFCGLTSKLDAQVDKHRIIDMPISESCFTGMALGLSLHGILTFVEYNFSGLAYIALDQIYNQIFKYSEMTGHPLEAPVILLMPTGTKGYRGVHHSDNTYTTLVALGVTCSMPVLSSHVTFELARACTKKELHCMFLPMEEFPNSHIEVSPVKDDPQIAYLARHPNSNSCVVSTGSSITAAQHAISLYQALEGHQSDLITFSSLNLGTEFYRLIASLGYHHIVFADDSYSRYGIFSDCHQMMSGYNGNISVVARSNNVIPYAKALEQSRRCNSQSILTALCMA